jgi:hypothetical protein
MNIFPRKSWPLWDDVKKYGRARQVTGYTQIIRRMRTACWITKATDTQNMLRIIFPQQQRLHERTSMLRLYIHCLSCSDFSYEAIEWSMFQIKRSHVLKVLYNLRNNKSLKNRKFGEMQETRYFQKEVIIYRGLSLLISQWENFSYVKKRF